MNVVCIVFELGDKVLTLSSMENLIVQCNHIRRFINYKSDHFKKLWQFHHLYGLQYFSNGHTITFKSIKQFGLAFHLQPYFI